MFGSFFKPAPIRGGTMIQSETSQISTCGAGVSAMMSIFEAVNPASRG